MRIVRNITVALVLAVALANCAPSSGEKATNPDPAIVDLNPIKYTSTVDGAIRAAGGDIKADGLRP
ncbi:hypothetical protein BGZ50_009038, partial [Haplosporangium sp. Z 11]